LEVLQENDFPIDYIAALSGGTIVAASYASGTMHKLKEMAFKINKEVIFSLIERSKGKGGLYHLDRVEELLRTFTKNYNFEDVTPRLGFVATDIIAGEEVVLQVGDLAQAVCASCSLPVVFQPREWGNKVLVDGGIINIVPGNVARQANMDLVIGLDLRATRHIFSAWQIYARRIVNKIKTIIWPEQVEKLWQYILDKFQLSDFWQNNFYLGQSGHKLKGTNLFTVIGRSLDIAIKAQQEEDPARNFDCDLIISPELEIPFWKKMLFIRFAHIANTKDYYLDGRKAAEENLPKMWQLLKNKEQTMHASANVEQTQDERLKELFIK
jgi:predicted acylesterase/phospholipase RssA